MNELGRRTRRRIICHEIGFEYENIAEAAEDLQISYRKLYYYLQKKELGQTTKDVNGYTFDFLED